MQLSSKRIINDEYNEFADLVFSITKDVSLNFKDLNTAKRYLRALDRRIEWGEGIIYYSMKTNEDGTITVKFTKNGKPRKTDWIIRNMKAYGNCLIPDSKIKQVGINEYRDYLSYIMGYEVTIRTITLWGRGGTAYIAERKKDG